MTDMYKHEPLKLDHSFRVLKLHPSKSVHTSLSCELFEVRLYTDKNNHSFEALSYAWGNPGIKRPVTCHGKQILVTTNCDTALRRMRHQFRARELYVDAICINQTDTKEKEQQVKLMGEIYSKARRVLVWLGPGSPKTDHAFRHFRRLYPLHNFLEDGDTNPSKGTIAEKLRNLVWKSVCSRHAQLQKCSDSHLHFWLEFIDQPYFERLWPLQETATAANTLLICGQATASMEAAKFAHRFMSPYWLDIITGVEYFSSLWYRLDGYSSHSDLKWVYRLREHRAVEQQSKYLFHLRDVLLQTRSLKATDPRDKLYALYSILKDVCLDFPQPDYARSMNVLWISATISLIISTRSLDILMEVNSEDRMLELPSWAFDWKGDGVDIRWFAPDDFWLQDAPTNTAWTTPPAFDGNVDVPTSIRFMVNGKICSSIVRRSPDPEKTRAWYHTMYLNAKEGIKCSEQEDDKALLEMTQTIYKWARLASQYSHRSDKGDFLQAFHDLLIWEMASEAPEFSDFQLWYSILIGEHDHGMAALNAPRSALTQSAKSDSPDFQLLMPSLKAIGDQFHERLCPRKTWRCFFLTSDGVMGDAYHTAQEGDLVILLCWARLPAIIRPNGSGYSLVGFAYVEDQMDYRSWNLREEDLEEFILV